MDGQLDGFPSLSDPTNLDARHTATVGETSHDPVTTIFASGGTTGDPKGVMMRASAWTQLVLSSSISVGHHHPVKLLVSPVFQTAGGVGFLSDLALGCTHVLLRRFDPDAIFFAIERYRVTYMFLAPTALNILLAQPDVSRYDYSSLRHLIYGGAPIASARVVEAMEVMGPVMATGFAQTETGGPVTFLSPREHSEFIQAGRLDRLSSCGRETLLSRVEVMNDDGDLLSAGEEGEVVVKSSHMMCGYYRSGMRMLDPDVDAERDWHRTGDVGTKDDEGYVFLLDRKKDMIISGAYNIYPAEIERFLEGQNGVCACAVVGAPDSTMGEVVRAVVELRPGASIDPRELVRICRENLPAMKTPSSIEIWRELPKNASGKVLRRQVREHFWAGRDRRI
jgi:acyl-CoA synthetase (AMP-forming)/AMP-acid ligase II